MSKSRADKPLKEREAIPVVCGYAGVFHFRGVTMLVVVQERSKRKACDLMIQAGMALVSESDIKRVVAVKYTDLKFLQPIERVNMRTRCSRLDGDTRGTAEDAEDAK